jgi:hypothetical protein
LFLTHAVYAYTRFIQFIDLNANYTMNKLKYLTAILIAVAGLGLQQAQAHLLDPVEFFHNGPIGNPSAELAYLQNNGGPFLPATSQFLFKQNNDGTTDGNFGQYFTISDINNNGNGTNTATISWNLTGSGMFLDGVMIKDGKIPHTDNMLYRFYGVSADETLIGLGTVSFNGKNISHVEFLGSPGGSVPDGGTTIMLLGAALGSLGMARRFLKK